MRLTDVDKLTKLFDERAITLKGIMGDLGGACSGASKLIKVQPTIQFELPKKGKWLHIPLYPDGGENYMCSECGNFGCLPYWNYCPNCGAKMERKNDEIRSV